MRRSSNRKGVKLDDLATELGVTVDGDDQVIVCNVAPIESAGPEDISFVANEKYIKHIETTQAAALILDLSTPCTRAPVRFAVSTILSIFK